MNQLFILTTQGRLHPTNAHPRMHTVTFTPQCTSCSYSPHKAAQMLTPGCTQSHSPHIAPVVHTHHTRPPKCSPQDAHSPTLHQLFILTTQGHPNAHPSMHSVTSCSYSPHKAAQMLTPVCTVSHSPHIAPVVHTHHTRPPKCSPQDAHCHIMRHPHT